MRLSYRVGLAALLIFGVVLIKRHLDFFQDDTRSQSVLQLNVGGNFGSQQQQTPAEPGSNGPVANPPVKIAQPIYETTPIIVPNDRVIVMAKLAAEDTAWVSNELAE